MSRSYRKPWLIQGYGSRYKQYAKNQANRRIRRSKDVPDGKVYRRFYNPWNICDWKYLVNGTNDKDAFYHKEFWRYNRK